MKKAKKEILIGVTGGISAYKACELVRDLMKKDYAVSVMMTKQATEFITPLTFRTLTNQPVIVDMFEENMQWDPCHISLADRADVVAVVPATANFIAKLANGLCDDITSCVIMATKAKILIAPAMNDNMFSHPAFTQNLDKIKKFGYKIISPIKGDLACGRSGMGHLAPVETISREIEKLLK
jgi:phosphopantothenoylcysteine decarboxylase / phosphopantothenate---cysteine ligase